MKRIAPLALLAFATPAFAATSASAWPPKLGFADGTEATFTGNFAWDVNRFAADADAFDDDQDWRRKEFGIAIKRKGLYDVTASYDFQSDTWMDVALRVESKGLTGHDFGRWRVGQMKLPLGFEGNTATRNGAFMENALPTQAFYQGRRIGVDWALERPRWLFNAGAYAHDLQGNNRGGWPGRHGRTPPACCTWACPPPASIPTPRPTVWAWRARRACAGVPGRKPH